MKKQFFVIIILFACVTGLNAQQRIVLVRAADGTSEVFDNIAQAYAAAIENDALYLSEGLFGILTINKKIKVYGAGHNPNNGGGVTQIASLTLASECDFCEIYGLHVIGNLVFNSYVAHAQIKRCRFDGKFNMQAINNCLFSECVFKGRLSGSSIASNNTFEKCIFQNSYVSIFGATFKNSIFYNYLNNSDGCIIENNIFLRNPAETASESIFEKNIFIYEFEPEDNYMVDSTPIFVNEANPSGFDYANDYTLQSGIQYLSGTDGKQVGPRFNDANHDGLKGNYAPDNPLVKLKTIGQYLNADGKLEVTIEVEAQDW